MKKISASTIARGRLALVLFVCLAAASLRAQVTGTASPPVLISGGSGMIPFSLASGGEIGAIQGELGFDPALLASPQVSASPGFRAESFELAPGVFRFVLFPEPDPFATLDLGQPVLHFGFDAAPGLPAAVVTTVTITRTAAARLLGPPGNHAVSIAVGGPMGTPPPESVVFNSFDVTILPESALDPTPTPPSPTPGPSATPACCPGNADGVGMFVDANDFIAVQGAFGTAPGPGGGGDANCSGGFVDAHDFIAVQAAFGANCP